MRTGDRVVVLASEQRGTVGGTTRRGRVLVRMDGDLEAMLDFHPHELEVCNAPPSRRGLDMPLLWEGD